MKFTYNWLKQYVDLTWSPEELAERLTFAGIEVEEVVTIGGGALREVVVCQILSSEKHANADKLSVCRITDGQGERQIVCGAKNYKVGDKVPLARPGVTLPNGMTIKEAKLRGVESQGMLCSAEELGLPKGEDGLLILPAETVVGIKLSDALGGVDTVFDIEVTPNRPDWLSVIGIAREVSALTGNPLKLPEVTVTESVEPIEKLTSVNVEAADLCPRYTARVIQSVKIGPSPTWLKQILEKVGLRSVNNVVDATNYVLLECGHPLHAFDYKLLAEQRIVVRRAAKGEQFVAIDGTQHDLTPEMLVIADAKRAVALAGIMGGKESEINDQTADVLLESAWFLPSNVRKTSKQSGLSSDSSYRFERGADIGQVIWASNRAARLIQQLAGGQIARGIVDTLTKPIEKRRVRCRYAQVNRLLGVEVPAETVNKIFTGLSLNVTATDATSCEVEVPTFRVDLEREVDLIEEICRIYGVEKIPAQMQPALPQVSEFDGQWDALARIRDFLTALGFHEALNQTLLKGAGIQLQNPLNADQNAVRSWLYPGLFGNLQTNAAKGQVNIKLFEIGKKFIVNGHEELSLGIVGMGSEQISSWQSSSESSEESSEASEESDSMQSSYEFGILDMKGAIEELAESMKIKDLRVTVATNIPQYETLSLYADILIGKHKVGLIGQLHQATARKLKLPDVVCVGELRMEPILLAARKERQFEELPKYPAIVRDVALVVDETVTHSEIFDVLDPEKHRNKFLERVELFDIYRGSSIPTGKKSMAYSLTFRAPDRTLTDAEINGAHEQLKRSLLQTLKCEIRES